jgi:arylformamidase
VRRYYDITLPYSAKLPAWPGEPKPIIKPHARIVDGDDANVTRIDAAVHYGTHMDAPVHFIEGATGIDAIPVDVLIGVTLVVELVDVDIITAPDLIHMELPQKLDRILFKTKNSDLWNNLEHEFYTDYVALSADAARFLVERGARLVGIDYLSVEPFEDNNGFATHKTLLGAGIILVEGLDLRAVTAGTYEIACLPMKTVNADGASARAVLWQGA